MYGAKQDLFLQSVKLLVDDVIGWHLDCETSDDWIENTRTHVCDLLDAIVGSPRLSELFGNEWAARQHKWQDRDVF